MTKIVTKWIKKIEFSRTHASLEAKYGGFLLFWVMVPLGGIALSGGFILGILVDPLFLLLFGGLGAALLLMAFFAPIFEWFEIDQAAQSFKYCSSSMKNRKDPAKAKVKAYPFDTLTINWQANYLGGSVVVLIKAKDRSRFTLTIPNTEHEALMKWLSGNPSLPQPENESIVENAQPFQAEERLSIVEEGFLDQKDARGHAAMLKEISSWGRSAIFLGVVHFIASGFLSPGWGVTLLAVGALSFIFKEASMFIMYAVTLIWVGISNIMSLEIGMWTFFGGYQIYLGAMLFKKYKQYLNIETNYLNSLEGEPSGVKVGRAAKLFPWLGALMSGFGLLVYVGVWVFVIAAVIFSMDTPDAFLSDSVLTILDLVAGVAIGIGIIGFGLSLSSVASKYKPKFVGWAGIVFGSLLVLAEIGINIWIFVSG